MLSDLSGLCLPRPDTRSGTLECVTLTVTLNRRRRRALEHEFASVSGGCQPPRHGAIVAVAIRGVIITALAALPPEVIAVYRDPVRILKLGVSPPRAQRTSFTRQRTVVSKLAREGPGSLGPSPCMRGAVLNNAQIAQAVMSALLA